MISDRLDQDQSSLTQMRKLLHKMELWKRNAPKEGVQYSQILLLAPNTIPEVEKPPQHRLSSVLTHLAIFAT